MRIAEVCAQCGAERPHWLGANHRHHDWPNGRYDALMCDDGQSSDTVWRTIRLANMSLPR